MYHTDSRPSLGKWPYFLLASSACSNLTTSKFVGLALYKGHINIAECLIKELDCVTASPDIIHWTENILGRKVRAYNVYVWIYLQSYCVFVCMCSTGIAANYIIVLDVYSAMPFYQFIFNKEGGMKGECSHTSDSECSYWQFWHVWYNNFRL